MLITNTRQVKFVRQNNPDRGRQTCDVMSDCDKVWQDYANYNY